MQTELKTLVEAIPSEQTDDAIRLLLERQNRENPANLTQEQEDDLDEAAKTIGKQSGNISEKEFEDEFPRS